MDFEWDAERRPVWERAVHSVNCARLLRTFMNCLYLLLSLLV